MIDRKPHTFNPLADIALALKTAGWSAHQW